MLKLIVLVLFAVVVAATRDAVQASVKCQLSTTKCKTTLHFTDIEGDWKYFNALKKKAGEAKALTTDKDGKPVLAADHCFVAGGDSGDKGVASLRVIRWLVQLKESAPDRVCLIVGNRDGNKLRFWSELTRHGDGDTLVPAKTMKPWSGHKTLEEACANKAGDGNTMDQKFMRLQCLLGSTMGSGTDELRREEELKALAEDPKWTDYNQRLTDVCKDDMKCKVYASYRLGAAPTGRKNDKVNLYTRYLEHAQIIAFMPGAGGKGGVFYVHGTVEPHHLFKVPPNKYPTVSETLKMTEIAGEGQARIAAWSQAYWEHMQAVMNDYNANAHDFKCTEEDWLKDGCAQRPGFMIVEMGMPAHDKQVRKDETMTYGRSASAPPIFWPGAGMGAPQGNQLKDLCATFEKGLVQAIVVGHTPRAVVSDMRYNAEKKCLTYNGDTSMQGGPLVSKVGALLDGRHHGCEESSGDTPCGGESNVLIKIKDDGTIDFEVNGHIQAKGGKLGGSTPKPDTEPKIFTQQLEHKVTVNTAAGDEWTLQGKQGACNVCQARHKARFPEIEHKMNRNKTDGGPIPKDEHPDEFLMQMRAHVKDGNKFDKRLCATARGFGFDYDVCTPSISPAQIAQAVAPKGGAPSISPAQIAQAVAPKGGVQAKVNAIQAKVNAIPKGGKGAAAAPTLRFRAKVAQFPHEQHVDAWRRMYDSADAVGFPGDGITS